MYNTAVSDAQKQTAVADFPFVHLIFSSQVCLLHAGVFLREDKNFKSVVVDYRIL